MITYSELVTLYLCILESTNWCYSIETLVLILEFLESSTQHGLPKINLDGQIMRAPFFLFYAAAAILCVLVSDFF